MRFLCVLASLREVFTFQVKLLDKSLVLILAVTGAALTLRLPRLEQRPMHTDEAVHAVKFGALLEDGYYRYDRHEYHGPTLNYLTLIPAWLGGERKFTEIDETTLRIVPVFFGVLLVAMLWFLGSGLGWPATIIAAILTAVSPAMAYYSRYYIQEMLIVCFTFGAIISGYRYSLSKKIVWAICAGAFLGLMHATKETCIIAYGAMVVALVPTLLMRERQSPKTSSPQNEESHRKGFSSVSRPAGFNRWVSNLSGFSSEFERLTYLKPRHALVGIAAACIVSALFFSSFLTSPEGVVNSILAYQTYFSRAGHDALHIHPWHYYLQMLLLSKYGEGPIWSEAFIVILAAIGFIVAMRRDHHSAIDSNLARFIAIYALIMTITYSIIPYKTPWNMIGFLHGMILLAAIGASAVIKSQMNKFVRVFINLLMIAGVAHLAWQAYLANYRYFDDSTNPYVYSHTVSDVYKVVSRVQEMASAHPDDRNMHIEVIFPGNDYWPLPWHLRAFPNVGWWPKVDEKTPAAPVIIASASVEQEVVRKLYELPPPGQRNLYLPLFDSYTELRPKIEMRGYVKKELWDKFEAQQTPLIEESH